MKVGSADGKLRKRDVQTSIHAKQLRKIDWKNSVLYIAAEPANGFHLERSAEETGERYRAAVLNAFL